MEFTEKEVKFLEKVITFKSSETQHKQDFLSNTQIMDGKDKLSNILFNVLSDKHLKEESQLRSIMSLVEKQNSEEINSKKDIEKVISKDAMFPAISTLVKSIDDYLTFATNCEMEVIQYITDFGIKDTGKALKETSGLIFEEKAVSDSFNKKLIQVLKQFDAPPTVPEQVSGKKLK